MITTKITYDEVKAAVEAGIFVVFAAGSINGTTGTAWMAAVLDDDSAKVAHSTNMNARAAQAIGVISHLRRQARRQGFKPA